MVNKPANPPAADLDTLTEAELEAALAKKRGEREAIELAEAQKAEVERIERRKAGLAAFARFGFGADAKPVTVAEMIEGLDAAWRESIATHGASSPIRSDAQTAALLGLLRDIEDQCRRP